MLNIFKTDNINLCSINSVEYLTTFMKKHNNLSEFAFIGRSNVGKSTLINKISYRNNLAFVSKNPGKTQAINFFNFGNKFALVDLPGYGHAEVSKSKLRIWSELITHYIINTQNLKTLFLLIDARRLISEKDLVALEWTEHYRIPITIIITKTDYILNKNIESVLDTINTSVKKFEFVHNQKILFSAKKRSDIGMLRKRIIETI